jgi:hypothetical protein
MTRVYLVNDHAVLCKGLRNLLPAAPGLPAVDDITCQIMQLQRGRLWVESQEAQDHCFFVELRCAGYTTTLKQPAY